jgi:2-polyprenyl-3-methyl-5-hydroxy-6-metoxy-1,4-benzoquinol methylase
VGEPCILCGGTAHEPLLTRVADYVTGTPGRWDLLTCTTCKVVTTAPPVPPADIHHYYKSDYSPFEIDPASRRGSLKTALRAAMLLPYRLRFGSAERQRAPFGAGRVLDVGCGSGALLAALAREGWICHCLDPSAEALARARAAVPSGKFFQGTIETFTTEHRFDLITLSHVLEHLADPRAALRKLHSLLAPGGELQLEVPNIGGAEARLFGRNWRGLDLPRHYVHFTPRTLGWLLRDTGFVMERQRTAFLASSIAESVMIACSRLVGRDLQHGRAARVVYYGLTPWASLSYLLGNVGAFEVVARAAPERL